MLYPDWRYALSLYHTVLSHLCIQRTIFLLWWRHFPQLRWESVYFTHISNHLLSLDRHISFLLVFFKGIQAASWNQSPKQPPEQSLKRVSSAWNCLRILQAKSGQQKRARRDWLGFTKDDLWSHGRQNAALCLDVVFVLVHHRILLRYIRMKFIKYKKDITFVCFEASQWSQ